MDKYKCEQCGKIFELKEKLMTAIEAFKTKDGRVFEDEESAYYHERDLELEEWYIENKLCGNYGSSIDLKNLIDYLKENKRKFQFLFK